MPLRVVNTHYEHHRRSSMGRKKGRKRRQSKNQKGRVRAGTLSLDRKNKSGHYQGTSYSDVYSDGKAHVYTAWNDNEEVVGAEMDFDEWAKNYAG
jgi:hypothetical protein